MEGVDVAKASTSLASQAPAPPLPHELARKRKHDEFELSATSLPTPPKSPPPTNVCVDCQQLDIAGVLHQGRALPVGERFRTMPRNKCPLCFMLSIACILWHRWLKNSRRTTSPASTRKNEGDVLIGLQFLGGDRFMRSRLARDQQDIESGPVFLAVVPSEHSATVKSYYRQQNTLRDCGDRFGYPVVLDKTQPPSICAPRAISTHFDPILVTSWIGYCERHHKSLCLQTNISQQNLHLVDCNTLHIVKAPQKAKYVALSYVWGSSSATCELDTSNLPSKLPSNLPLIVTDSIKVTQLLGYRYLWVDKFCIDQSNAKTKDVQIQHMDSVYEAAEITIVAAAGEDEDFGLPGVSVRSRKTQPVAILKNISVISTMQDPHRSIRESRWSTRGWTFQEAVLSRRRLVFTNEQVYFECNAMNCCESLASDLDRMHIKTRAKFRDSIRPGMFGRNEKLKFGKLDPSKMPAHHLFIQYLAAAEQYSSRHLRFDSDSLNAFRGIIRRFSKRDIPVRQLWGIPYAGIGTASDYFVDGLAWHHVHDCWSTSCIPKRREQFPSWSWAGWGGEVLYPTRDDTTYAGKSWFRSGVELVRPFPSDLQQSIQYSVQPLGSEADEPKALILSAYPLRPDQIFYSQTASNHWKIGRHPAKLFLSAGAKSEAEFFEALSHGQDFRCISLGEILGDKFVLVLQLSPDGEAYFRAGLFTVFHNVDWTRFLLQNRTLFKVI